MKVALSVVRARRERLAELLQQHRYLPVNELCDRLNISEATARRDLAVLQNEKKLKRTYGGALTDFERSFASFSERREMAAEAKSRIAKRAVSFINPNSTVFLDAGTTIFALAESLKDAVPGPLKIVTNSLPVADLLSRVDGVETHVPGGQLLGRQSALLGDGKKSALPFWKFDLAFMSAEGMSIEGIWNSQDEIAQFQKRVLQRTRHFFFCLDSGKIGRRAPSLVLGWGRVEKLITDAGTKNFRDAGIAIKPEQLIRS